MGRKQVMKCVKVSKKDLAKRKILENQQLRHCDSDVTLEVKAKRKQKKVHKKVKKKEIPLKPCGCPITIPDADDYYYGSDRKGIVTKSYFIDSNSSFISISNVDNIFEDNTRKLRSCKQTDCPCASPTFYLKNLATCDCRFSSSSIPRKQRSCPVLNRKSSEPSMSLQVSETIVEPLVRQQKTQTSFILQSDELASEIEEPRDCTNCEAGICPDYEPKPKQFTDDGEEHSAESSSCQETDVSPSPSNDYFLFWDRQAMTLDKVCPPRPPYVPDPILDMSEEPKLDMNECELLEYYKSQKVKKKTVRKHKKTNVEDMLRDWCPAAFKMQDASHNSSEHLRRKRKHRLTPDEYCYLDPLFNLKVLTDRNVKVKACCTGCLVPQDCTGFSYRPRKKRYNLEEQDPENDTCLPEMFMRDGCDGYY